MMSESSFRNRNYIVERTGDRSMFPYLCSPAVPRAQPLANAALQSRPDREPRLRIRLSFTSVRDDRVFCNRPLVLYV